MSLEPNVCLAHGFHSTPRNFQISVAKPFPPPKLRPPGTYGSAGGTAHRRDREEVARPGKWHQEWEGRHPPPGAGHPPCSCASVGFSGRPHGYSVSSSAASDVPQGPVGRQAKSSGVLAGAG